jgi:hypothetical protein
MAEKSQQQRILDMLRVVRGGEHDIPGDFLRRHDKGDGLSTRYFKQVMLISECNGRISELRAKGYVIETSEAEDEYGFKYHRLVLEPGEHEVTGTLPLNL